MSGNLSCLLGEGEETWKKNLILPGNESCEESEFWKKEQDSQPFVIVRPTPGVCIKVKNEGTGEKVFLNLCTSDEIPPPKDMSESKLLSVLVDASSNTFVIPLSIGHERLEADKSGNMCCTYDIAMNTSYFQKCREKETLWIFTVSVILEAVGEKFNKKLVQEQVVVLKNRKAMGKLQVHKIEKRDQQKRPELPNVLIEEISSSNTQYNSRSKPKQLLLRHPAKGTPTLLIGLFTVPKGSMGKDISVLVYDDRVVVEALNTTLLYDIDLPYKVQAESAKSFLDTNLGVLRVNMPIENEQGGSKVQ